MCTKGFKVLYVQVWGREGSKHGTEIENLYWAEILVRDLKINQKDSKKIGQKFSREA